MTNPLFDFLIKNNVSEEKVFIKTPDGESYSYKDFENLTAQFANLLIRLGVKPSDRMALQVEKSPEALAIYLAVIRIGAVFLPLNAAYTEDEVSYFLADCRPSLLIKGEAPFIGGATLEIKMSDFLEKAKSETKSFINIPKRGDDLAAILYTSGTTGRSKGVMLSHNNLISNASSLIKLWQFTQQDILLHALPIYHTHGLFVATNVIMGAGASMVFLPKFKAETVIEYLPQTNVLMGVPTFYTRLLKNPKFNKEIIRHFRLFVSGSAPLLPETHLEFEERTGHIILERYGMTETNMNTSNPYMGKRKAGTVGQPLEGVSLRIVDEVSGDIIEEGGIGVIEVKGPNVFKGYWEKPELNSKEFKSDGYFITGDLGRIDKDGFVEIVGRSKDLIISGGYNVYPKEVEDVVNDINGVLESAVIGCPHPDLGEGVICVIVKNKDSVITEDQIKSLLKTKLAGYKIPKHLYFSKELPRNIMGKVQKNILRDSYLSSFN